MLSRYLDVFRSLQQNKARYVVIGGIAAIRHGVARNTFDLDILIEATPRNAKRVLGALVDAGLDVARLATPESLLENEITIFRDQFQIDVQTRTPGLRFETAWKNREVVEFRGQQVVFASRKDIIRSKRAAGRPQDLSDVDALLAPPDELSDPDAMADG